MKWREFIQLISVNWRGGVVIGAFALRLVGVDSISLLSYTRDFTNDIYKFPYLAFSTKEMV